MTRTGRRTVILAEGSFGVLESKTTLEAAWVATGLPVTDPIKSGVDALMEPIRKVVKRG